MKSEYKKIKVKLQQQYNEKVNRLQGKWVSQELSLREERRLLQDEVIKLKEEKAVLEDKLRQSEDHVERLIEYLNLTDEEKKLLLKNRRDLINGKQQEVLNVYMTMFGGLLKNDVFQEFKKEA